MASKGSVTIRILGDASDFQNAIGKVDKSAGGLGGSFAKLGGIAVGVFGAAGVGAMFKGALDAAAEAQKVAAQTDAVLKSTGGAAGVTSKYVGDLAHSLQNMSGVSDETIQSGQNMLLTFTNIRDSAGKNNDIFSQATKTMLDMSVAMGSDASSTAIQLGKALNDPVKGISALTKVGVTFTEQQKDQIKAMIHAGDAAGAQRLILAELNKEFGGSAKAAGDVMTPMAKLSMKFGDMQEVLGTWLLPKIASLVEWGGKVVEWAKRNSDVLVPLAAFLGGVAVAVGAVVAAMRIWTAVQAALNVVMTANPIVLIGAAVVALGAVLVIAYQRSETFRKIVEAAFGAVVQAAMFMKDIVVSSIQILVNVWLGAAELIVKGAAKAFGSWVPGIGGKLKDAAKAVEGFRDEVNSTLAGIKAWDPTGGKGVDKNLDRNFTKFAKVAVPAAKEVGTQAGAGLMGGFTDALDKKTKTATAKAKTVAEQVGSILGSFGAMDRRKDALDGITAAQESLNEALMRQSALPVAIARAEKALADARKDAGKTTTDEALAVLDAEDAVTAAQLARTEAQDALTAAQKDGTVKAADLAKMDRDLRRRTLEVAQATDDLAAKRRAASADTSDVTDAERALKELLDEQTAVTKRVKDAQDALTQAKLSAIEAEKAYLDTQKELAEVTPKAIELFRQLAEKVGLSRDQVDQLTGAFGRMKSGLGASLPNLGSSPVGGNTEWRSPVAGFDSARAIADAQAWALQDAQLQAVLKGGAKGGTIFGFDSGGVVPGPRGASMLAMVHGGETILPTHKGGGSGMNITIIGKDSDTISLGALRTGLLQLNRMDGPLPITIRG